MGGDVEHLAEDVAELSDAFRVVDFIPQLVHHAYLDELAELADDWLPECVHLYCLDALRTTPISVAFELLCVVYHRFRLRCLWIEWSFNLRRWALCIYHDLFGAAYALIPRADFSLTLRVEKLVWVSHKRGHWLRLTALAQHGRCATQ